MSKIAISLSIFAAAALMMPVFAADGTTLINQSTVLASSGPLSSSGAGDLTKWMSVPWQADTASCLQGYANYEVAKGGPFNDDP